jgi:hypothetical protein
MALVELRDIVTDDDRSAVLALRVAPGQERFVASVERSFRDAITDAGGCPRMWAATDAATREIVGFVMISDGIPADALAADPELIGPYFLWRLLIDQRYQRRGYGTGGSRCPGRLPGDSPVGRRPVHELCPRRRVAPAVLRTVWVPADRCRRGRRDRHAPRPGGFPVRRRRFARDEVRRRSPR